MNKMKFFVPEPPEAVSLCLKNRQDELIPGPIKLIRKSKQAALDQILMDTKKRAKKLEMKQIFSKFVDGLKIFYPQDYEEILKEKQE